MFARDLCGGGLYTWSNNQAHPTLEKLDRILMNSEWKDLFPLVTTRKLVRDISDHNPLVLSTNSACPQSPKPREFRFEMSWMTNEEFLPLVNFFGKGLLDPLIQLMCLTSN